MGRFINIGKEIKKIDGEMIPILFFICVILGTLLIGKWFVTEMMDDGKKNDIYTYESFDNGNVTIKLKLLENDKTGNDWRISINVTNNDTYQIQIRDEYNHDGIYTYTNGTYETIKRVHEYTTLELQIYVTNLKTDHLEVKTVVHDKYE